jgi:hypothetical protein
MCAPSETPAAVGMYAGQEGLTGAHELLAA